ncbi:MULTISPECIES: hypothetical protein [unclassified Novosphingobium]|uniref:hypothetical protein n=2 Tax=unclassified Novosphingobium TaxID=2644732 RepID=UPI001493E0F8|nr:MULTISPECIES: hypothetical protein [unclassified Novosphingobium]MBB3376921.1 hypothetical protein [Novosphingobium sp. BK280]MBB3600309.1 hypothetical protein [Novosphingobium sp. BK540]MBB3360125.1 hypothetical protein [Novosphingobium sp. BK256]MBB3381293.1 hypothetical protein [Novosphingobium sp. BK258]MBB3422982.1 hypothetical protein [Novosphingobium sp. BK267]
MGMKNNVRISCIFIILNIGIFNAPSGFCQQFTYSHNIDNISNIKFDLVEGKKDASDASLVPRSIDLPEDSKVDEPYIDQKKEQNYKTMRKNLRSLEIIYQTLNFLDAIQTIGCMQKSGCQEKNPLFGNHPSVGKIIAIKSLAGLIHYSAYKHGIKRDDRLKYTLSMEIISIAVQGTVVGLNFRAII